MKCGFTAGAAAEQGANKSIAVTVEIKELIYFIDRHPCRNKNQSRLL
nr:MAG TPA: hypothetical protein [Bacteriophage sp.]